MYSLCMSVGRCVRSLLSDRRGSVYAFIGVALIPMLAAMGIALDSARGYLVRARLSQALDAAALAGARVFDSATRDADIRMYFNANFAQSQYQATITPNPPPTIVADTNAGTLTLSANAVVPTTFMRVVGFNTLNVHAETTVTRLNREMELVLAMDNTGSMAQNSKMSSMQTAALNLLSILYGTRDTVDRFNVGVVPFVSSVNVGNQYTTWAPALTTATSVNIASIGRIHTNDGIVRVRTATPHGFRNGDIVNIANVNADGGGVGNCAGLAVNRNQLIAVDTSLINAYISMGLPYDMTRLGVVNATWTTAGWNAATDFTFRTTYYSGCVPTAPTSNSNPPSSWAIGGATVRLQRTIPAWYTWNGCVEARQDPYEDGAQAEATPTAAPFKRYFWPSTDGVRLTRTDANSNSSTYFNSWSNVNLNEYDDYPFANNWTPANYNSSINPNRGCGAVSIVPLQPSRATAEAAINAMSPTGGNSYTHSNIGLAWGLRVLSPSYRGLWQNPSNNTLPGDYDTNLRDKVVVLLTDGQNTFGACQATTSSGVDCGNDYNNYLSAYTAYGHLEQNATRLGSATSDSVAITNMNARVTSLCTQMKGQGIIIYTILLQENDSATQTVFQNCATDINHYFLSPTAADLNGIFTTIANQLRRLRISR